jgi:hypothetical protein
MTRGWRIGLGAAILSVVAIVAITANWSPPAADAAIVLERVPNGGIQPQALADRDGSVHVVYYRGDARAGDLYYVRRGRDGRYSAPLRVNSQARSAIATGSVRGAQIAAGRNGVLHVIWNGSPSSQPKLQGGMPLFYTRLAAGAFEPQRNLLTTNAIDGGGAVVADEQGHVFVAWHAVALGKSDATGAVFLRRSDDDGVGFGAERRATNDALGACACCSMRGLVDRGGTLRLLYRAAGRDVDRDSMQLVSRDLGETFTSTRLQPWRIGACPLSSFAMIETRDAVIAAWETAGRIFFQRGTAPPHSAPGSATSRKHPVLAANDRGDVLAAWLEGTAWERGGSVAWQRYDANGVAVGERGSADGIPVWGLAAAAPLADGRFLLVY